MDILEKKVQNFIGPQGLLILKKAIKQTNSDVNVLEELQILPRAVIAWAFNVAKNLSNKTFKSDIPDTNYVLSIKKNNNKFDFELIQKTETVLSQQSVELPAVIFKLLEVTNTLETVEKNFNNNLEDLQKAVNFLVAKFHFGNSVKVTLSKSETQARCPDCGDLIRLDENHNKLCVCFRILKNHLYVKKNENGSLSVKFSDKWSKENIYLLMKSLKAKL